MAFEGPKDLAHKIMEDLDDRSLLEYCLVNRYTSRACADQAFWRRRFVKKYGEMAAQYSSSQNSGHGVYKPEGRSWRNHYLQVVIDLDKFSDDPVGFLRYIQWSPQGHEYSYYNEAPQVLGGPRRKLEDAPEWVLNNFYLLDLGRGYVNNKMEDHVTPFMLFQSESRYIHPDGLADGVQLANYNWRVPHLVHGENVEIGPLFGVLRAPDAQ